MAVTLVQALFAVEAREMEVRSRGEQLIRTSRRGPGFRFLRAARRLRETRSIILRAIAEDYAERGR